MLRMFLGLVVSMLVTAAGCDSVVVVQPQEVGVVFNRFTGDLGDPLMPGTHFINPLADEVTIYSTSQQELTLAAPLTPSSNDPYGAVEVWFADGEEAEIDESIFFGIDPEKVNIVHKDWQDRYPNDFILPTTRSVIRNIAARYSAEALVLNQLWPDLRNDIEDELSADFADEGFILYASSIRNITFSKAFVDRIEQRLLTSTAEAARATPSS